jgi:hypothetical protein
MTAIFRANLRQSLRDLEYDLERARDSLFQRNWSAIPGGDIEEFIIRNVDGEPTGFDEAQLTVLLDALNEASGDLEFAFLEFDREVREALRTFKQQYQQCLREVS